MIHLYMDVQFPLAVTQQLRLRNVDVITAQEDRAARLRDPELLDRASELGRVLVTQDKDFLVEASLRQKTNRAFLGVIYVPQIGLSIGRCVADLELLALDTDVSEWGTRVEYLPSK